MKCIILAAGYATRLYPLTKNYPKPLLMVAGKTIIDWLIDDISGTDIIDEFYLVTNHKFYRHFTEWASKRSENIFILDDGSESNSNRLGAVNDLYYAVQEMAINEDVLVIAGDNVVDFSLSSFILNAKKRHASCVMTYRETSQEKCRKTAIVTFDDKDRITTFEEKPECPKGDHAVPPFYYYTKEDILRLDEAIDDGCNVDAPGSFAEWISKKSTLYAYCMPGNRYDIGDIESYNYVNGIYKGFNDARLECLS